MRFSEPEPDAFTERVLSPAGAAQIQTVGLPNRTNFTPTAADDGVHRAPGHQANVSLKTNDGVRSLLWTDTGHFSWTLERMADRVGSNSCRLSSSPLPSSRSLAPSSSQSWAAALDSDEDDEPTWLTGKASNSKAASSSASTSTLKRTRSGLASSPSVEPSQRAGESSPAPSSPPTSSATHNSSNSFLRRSPRRSQVEESEPKRARTSTGQAAPAAKLDLKGKAKAGPVNLHSFFAPVSPRRRETNSSHSPSPTARSARASSPTKAPPTKKKAKAAALTQLYLDPYETSGHSTISCTECSLTYARTPEDMTLHKAHHAKVVAGCDWLAPSAATSAKGVTVLHDGVEWSGGKEGGKVVMVDANAEGIAGKRLREALETVDTSLSATALSPDQLAESKAFLFVTPQRKIIACALVQRIKLAYRVLDQPSDEQTASASPVVGSLGSEPADRLLQFGDKQDDEGAIFCEPTALPTLLGVHRIWTSPSHRRAGLATILLNAAAQRMIYGYPIAKARRGMDVAFSQPTGKGQALARRWTGGGELRVFVD